MAVLVNEIMDQIPFFGNYKSFDITPPFQRNSKYFLNDFENYLKIASPYFSNKNCTLPDFLGLFFDEIVSKFNFFGDNDLIRINSFNKSTEEKSEKGKQIILNEKEDFVGHVSITIIILWIDYYKLISTYIKFFLNLLLSLVSF